MLHPASAAGKGQSGPGTAEGPWGNRARWPHAPRVGVRNRDETRTGARTWEYPEPRARSAKVESLLRDGGVSMQKASERGDLK